MSAGPADSAAGSATSGERATLCGTTSWGLGCTVSAHCAPLGWGARRGERPIGAAKGKQTKTMASCQPPPPPPGPSAYAQLLFLTATASLPGISDPQ